MHAIVITTLGEARSVELSDDAHHAEIRRILGGSPDRAVYHREALLWIHGNGAGEGLPSNLPAWTLACAWRGLTLDYELFGDVVITGRTSDGDAEALPARLAEQAHTVTATTLETIRRWQQHPPASNEAGLNELLAYAARDVAK
ncbi:DUF3846 domain-containing protein [Streptacidiphilus anmyonensis]|uniref:DUF3846 domain-containing protein n=1 Tax=Streptacidiphilus anmyonensis TaxID=405782 RepID=UPI0005A5EB3B|nr:hypothetical protein [Streptacidiphilus anmyonensis]